MTFSHKTNGWLCIIASIVISFFLTLIYIPMWKDDLLIPGEGVSEVKWLSDYLPELKGTLADTRVYILDSQEPGANIAVIGGHHSDEPAGWLSAIILLEKAKVKTGKLVVIPQANNSGFTHNYSQEAHPQFITIPLPDGKERVFRIGSRPGNCVEHWPDPEVFYHYPSKQKLSGDEIRNLNRAYPGRFEGTFTERQAYAIQMLIRKENIDLQIDLHEAQPEYPFVNAVSAHPRSVDLASMASLALQGYYIDLGVESSPPTFRGLSNREMADVIPTLYAVVMETVNPMQGKIRGITDAKLPIEGKDAFYVAAAKFGNLFTPFTEEGWPIKRRVGRHLTAIRELAASLSDFTQKPFEFDNVPVYEDLEKNDIGYYLNSPPTEIQDPGFRALPGAWRLITQK